MESNPLRGLFGVSSPRLVEQRVAPQPNEPTENENDCFEIPLGMIEKLLANPFLGDGTKHPDEHLIYVDEVCGLFKLAGVPGDVVKRKVFTVSLKGDAAIWYGLCDDMGSWNYKLLKLEFHQKFYPMHLVHRDRIPLGMIEKLLANPFIGDGTLHPDLHLIYVDEVCGLFKLAGMPEDVIKKRVFPLFLKGKSLTWFGLGYVMIWDHGTTTD